MDFSECNKCGKCKETCPSYSVFINEAFSPRGRVQISNFFKEGNLSESKALKERLFSCLLCGSCLINCPLQVNIPNLMYEAREKTTKDFKLFLFKYFSLYPNLFFSLIDILKNLKILKNIFKKQKILPTTLIDKMSVFEKSREKTKSLKIFNKIKPRGRIALFLGCSTEFLMPSISKALIDILSAANFEVIIPKQICCGAPLLGAGFKEEMLSLAKKNLNIYKSFHIDGVITPCPTCAHFLSSIYGELMGEGIKILNLADLIEELDLVPKQHKQEKIFFHVSCHSSNYVKEYDKTIRLFTKSGINIEKKEGCCGFAGLFSFLFEKESMDILRKKVLEYEKADMIMSSCPNCLIQFKFAMENKKVLHYAEFIQKNFLKGE